MVLHQNILVSTWEVVLKCLDITLDLVLGFTLDQDMMWLLFWDELWLNSLERVLLTLKLDPLFLECLLRENWLVKLLIRLWIHSILSVNHSTVLICCVHTLNLLILHDFGSSLLYFMVEI